MQNNLETQLSAMSLPDLLNVQEHIKGLIVSRRRLQQKELEHQVREMVRAQGLELEDIVLRDRNMVRRPKKVASAQYRNPKNPTQTWSGLGKRPNWLKAYLADGGVLERLKITTN